MGKARAVTGQATVYGLVDAEKPEEIVYVGCSIHVDERVTQHRGGYGSEAVRIWARNMANAGRRIDHVVLEHVPCVMAPEIEQWWIEKLWGEKAMLLNTEHIPRLVPKVERPLREPRQPTKRAARPPGIVSDKVVEHGTTTSYASGCRCDECRLANANYMSDYRRRKSSGDVRDYRRSS